MYSAYVNDDSADCLAFGWQGRVSDDMVGTNMKVKFLEVDEESQRLVFSNRRASSQSQMAGHKVKPCVVSTFYHDVYK